MQRLMILAVTVLALAPVWAFAQATPVGSPVAGLPVASPAANDLGTSVRWLDWTVTVERAEFADAVAPESFEPRTARGKFLVLHLYVVNESPNPLNFPVSDVRARDDRGRSFDMDDDAASSLLYEETGMLPALDNLQPGVPYDFVMVFDVAPDAHGFVLALPGTGDITIRLGI